MKTLRMFVLPVALGLLFSGTLSAQRSTSCKVIVNAANAVSSLAPGQVSRLFLREVTRWDNGTAVLPVDQIDTSAVRSHFSKAVLGRDVSAVNGYWQRQIFSGRGLPPVEKASDEEVLAYVKANPGAIGYVSADAPTDGVKVVRIQ